MLFRSIGFAKSKKYVLYFLLFVILVVGISEILKSEVFKSKKVLVANLKDDFSAIYLTLRENKTFEISSVAIFASEEFKGKYKLINNKLIFLNKPYDNNLIPDTVTILQDKIILKFNSNGTPDLSFASYFTIQQNLLKNGP